LGYRRFFSGEAIAGLVGVVSGWIDDTPDDPLDSPFFRAMPLTPSQERKK
jgi:hypothetical protein